MTDDPLRDLKFDAEMAGLLGVTHDEFADRAAEALQALQRVLRLHTDGNPMLAVIFLQLAAAQLCGLPHGDSLIRLQMAIAERSYGDEFLIMPATPKDRVLMSESLLNRALVLDLALMGNKRRPRRSRDADRLRELAVLMEPAK
jgi:hypothetical protein